MGCSVALEELIARQRANLRNTFVQTELPAVEPRSMERIARTEHELAKVTDEFTEAYEQRFGPLPCLHQAVEAMQGAAAALDEKNAKSGRDSEGVALANLIKARQNIRKLLSQSSSSSASACRKFDQEQKQKLRPPKKEGNEKERLAKLQNEIEQLAKEEKKFSEDIESKSDGGAQMESDKQAQKNSKSAKSKSGSGSGGSSSGEQKSAQSKPSLAERQDQAARKAAELQQLVNKDDALTELARERMDAAAKTVQQSADALRNGREQEAGKDASDAAEQLERLARQVAALKAPDLPARLASTQSLAQELAGKQQSLGNQMQEKEGKSGQQGRGQGQASAQQSLSEDAKTLADLLPRNVADAAEADQQLGQALREAAEKNSPAAIAEQMKRAAEALQAGKNGQARRDAKDAGERLQTLAQQLDATRRALVQPQLEKLIATEKQAAEAQKALNAVANDQQKAEAEKKMLELRDGVDSLKAMDAKIDEASQGLADAVRAGSSNTWNSGGRTPRGMYRPPVAYVNGVNRTIVALQAKIQDLILKDALLDKDEAVPPKYKKLVEEYYRVLSEDLR
jgi:DNA repair exonuclease SbcCD ATPase subunit